MSIKKQVKKDLSLSNNYIEIIIINKQRMRFFMWYESLSKEQFRSYVTQDVRLNTAYWTATQGIEIVENKSSYDASQSTISEIINRITELLEAVHSDINIQKGVPKSLIQHQFEYVRWYTSDFARSIESWLAND